MAPSSSSQQRRKIMERVEDMVASIEARVRAKQEEGQHINNTSVETQKSNIVGTSFDQSSVHLSVENENSSSDEDEEEYDRARDLDSSIHVSDVSTSDGEEQEEFYQQKKKELDASQVYSSGSDESLESLFGSPDELPAGYKRTEEKSIPTPVPSTQQQTTKRSLGDDMDMEKHSTPQPQQSPFDDFRFHAFPQDRSVGSKVSGVSNESKSSKLSNVTPYQPYNAQPIISPPFALLSPAVGRAGFNPGFSRSNTKAYRGSVLSPPKVKTVHNSKSASKVRVNAGGKSVLYEMKKEIDDLTQQFSQLQENSRQRRARFNLDPEDRLDESLDVMGRKTNAMADALHRNFSRSGQLQKENDTLRENVQNLKVGSYSEKSAERKAKVYISPCTLLKELDPSDDYVKRAYPPIPKTPGTMFTTELVEVMGLETGEHAYLAELMDRQWKTSTDYRP